MSQSHMFPGYVMLLRSHSAHALLAADPLGFALLATIALRVNWHPEANFEGLERGQALVGDYEKMGFTRQEYRTRLKRFLARRWITTKKTNKGTIVTLTNSEIFDVFAERINQRDNQPRTHQQPARSRRITSNEEGKKKSREKGKKLPSPPTTIVVSNREIPLKCPEVEVQVDEQSELRRIMHRIGAIYERDPDQWTAREIAALKALGPLRNENVDAVVRYHALPPEAFRALDSVHRADFRRQSVESLLAHWSAEVDAARRYFRMRQLKSRNVAAAPADWGKFLVWAAERYPDCAKAISEWKASQLAEGTRSTIRVIYDEWHRSKVENTSESASDPAKVEVRDP